MFYSCRISDAFLTESGLRIYGTEGMTNQIKSLLSHHHSTCALVSEILESVVTNLVALPSH